MDALADLIRESPDYEKRMAAARARAEWEIGDASHATTILFAFLNPDTDTADLVAEMA